MPESTIMLVACYGLPPAPAFYTQRTTVEADDHADKLYMVLDPCKLRIGEPTLAFSDHSKPIDSNSRAHSRQNQYIEKRVSCQQEKVFLAILLLQFGFTKTIQEHGKQFYIAEKSVLIYFLKIPFRLFREAEAEGVFW